MAKAPSTETTANDASAPSEAERLAAKAAADREAAEKAGRAAAADRFAAENLQSSAAIEREAAESARATAEAAVADAAADLRAAKEERRRPAPATSPASVELQPVVVPRPPLQETMIQERAVARPSSGYAPAVDPTAPLFPATARVFADGRVVSAQPTEQQSGPTAEVTVNVRVLHDNVLYEPGAPARVTRAQFLALRAAGAVDGIWPAD